MIPSSLLWQKSGFLSLLDRSFISKDSGPSKVAYCLQSVAGHIGICNEFENIYVAYDLLDGGDLKLGLIEDL